MDREGTGRARLDSTAIDMALREWRQGDCVLEPQWFVFRLSRSFPITEAARVAMNAGVDLAEEETAGFVVVTQTCDIARPCTERPYVELCPLIEVSSSVLEQVKRARRPAMAFIPALEGRRLVADLDRVMTAEKAVVAQWSRTAGWSADAELRTFCAALARKRVRFAFPDDFVEFVRPLQSRLDGKHGKQSPEGRALRALREIRVAASPSWNNNQVGLTFFFVRADDNEGFPPDAWSGFLEKWLELMPAGGRFAEVDGIVTTLDALTAAEYVASDPLDLDHLSSSPVAAQHEG